MKRLLAVSLVLAVTGVVAPAALADPCVLPASGPVWVDFAGHDAPIQVKPGMVLSVASGTDTPAQFRAAGAATMLFDLNFNKRVGTTANPADPSLITGRAKTFYDYAVSVTGCDNPLIAENELAGAQTATPWTPNNDTYRANVLAFLTALSNLGARPLISVPNPPFTASDEAKYWWQQVSQVAIILRQVYFTSPNTAGLSKLGSVAASRSMRQGMRSLVGKFTAIGIPSGRIALEMQFTSAPGLGTRAGLEPTSAWLEIVKLEALAAKAVTTQFKLAGVWSWGWATFSTTATIDPDKAAAACVWLWVRDQSLCDAPTVGGPSFDPSLTVGQLTVPANDRCIFDGGEILRNAVSRFTTLTGDAGYATSVLLEQAVLAVEQPVDPRDVQSAERAVIQTSFGGDRARYRAALTAAKLTLGDARTIIAARLQKDEVESRFRPAAPTAARISDFLATYSDQSVRLVSTTRRAAWLGGTTRGWAVATLAPAEVFTLAGAGQIDTPDGAFDVTPTGPALPLGLIRHADAVAAARTALTRLARETNYRNWLHGRELALLETAVCQNDQVPTPTSTDLTPFVPFLLPS